MSVYLLHTAGRPKLNCRWDLLIEHETGAAASETTATGGHHGELPAIVRSSWRHYYQS